MVESEKSCGMIVFRKNKTIKYLILYKKASDHYRETWDFPKGNVEPGESEKETALREAREETGIDDIQFIPGFRKIIKLFYRKEGKLVHKEIVFFLGRTKQLKVKISHEHNSYKWLGYDNAIKILTFKNSKEILKEADEFLKKIKETQIRLL